MPLTHKQIEAINHKLKTIIETHTKYKVSAQSRFNIFMELVAPNNSNYLTIILAADENTVQIELATDIAYTKAFNSERFIAQIPLSHPDCSKR